MKFNTLCYISEVRLRVPSDLNHKFSKLLPKKAPLKTPEVFHSAPKKLLKNKTRLQKVSKVAKTIGTLHLTSFFTAPTLPAQPRSAGEAQHRSGGARGYQPRRHSLLI